MTNQCSHAMSVELYFESVVQATLPAWLASDWFCAYHMTFFFETNTHDKNINMDERGHIVVHSSSV